MRLYDKGILYKSKQTVYAIYRQSELLIEGVYYKPGHPPVGLIITERW